MSRGSIFSDLSAFRAQLLLAKAAEPETNEEALYFAFAVYWQSRVTADAEADGPDNLEHVKELAAALASELRGETPCSRAARLRLVTLLGERDKWDDGTVAIYDREDAVADQLDGLIDILDVLTEAATNAHQQSHGNQRKKDLRAAYRVLADFWQQQEGTRNFTSGWRRDEKNGDLAPISPAACFLFDALRLIDPDRKELAKELRDLMADTVQHLPGRRRGRRG